MSRAKTVILQHASLYNNINLKLIEAKLSLSRPNYYRTANAITNILKNAHIVDQQTQTSPSVGNKEGVY
jgi:hypothetical protein